MKASARLVFRLPSYASVTQLMHNRLHWLDVPQRIKYKLCVLTFKCIHKSDSGYLSRHCTSVSSLPGRSQLRSAAAGQLVVPFSKTKTLGAKGFDIFIVRQLQEKYLARNEELWMAFVDLEKAFDRVPREVVWWALRCLGVDEWIVSVIKAMYEDATTTVRVNGRESKAFSVRVGVHQGSVLSPLLFIIVLEALSREFREGLPMELLYADDLVLVAETEELLMEKLRKWKSGMELKGLRVNIGKT